MMFQLAEPAVPLQLRAAIVVRIALWTACASGRGAPHPAICLRDVR
jgi:hypothetical protein